MGLKVEVAAFFFMSGHYGEANDMFYKLRQLSVPIKNEIGLEKFGKIQVATIGYSMGRSTTVRVLLGGSRRIRFGVTGAGGQGRIQSRAGRNVAS